jgi:hypothetical protein
MKLLKDWRGIALAAVVIFFSGLSARAQDCSDYFPLKTGTVLEYVHYDKKGKVTGSSEMSLREKKETPGGISVLFASSFKDDKGETLYDSEMQVECRNGVLYFDAGSLLDPEAMSAYESMEVEITGDHLELPVNAAAGTVLENGGVTAVVSSGGMKIMTLSVSLSNRKIAGRETVTTPAGSFDCVKYTYDALTQMGFVKVNGSGVEWYSHQYGTIRSESYDQKGNLSGYMVLESVSGN